jgi:hypothetical protein
VWEDRDFKPDEPAFYYVRVLEKPVCRYSTHWCRDRIGVDPLDLNRCQKDLSAMSASTDPLLLANAQRGASCCSNETTFPFVQPVIQLPGRRRSGTTPAVKRPRPALHMALIGAALFGGGVLGRGLEAPERPRIVIPASRLDVVRQTFIQDFGRPPEREEWAGLVDTLVDQEVLYQYALRLRMHEEPVAQRRLAQIASFVEATPHQHRPDSELAAQAVKLGLHEGDLVVRRILADGARRLIRAVVLTREPNTAMAEEYLAANPQLFERPAQLRITHVAVDGSGGRAGRKAGAALNRIPRAARAEQASWATRRSSGTLPLLTRKDIQTRFGTKFEEALQAAPEGVWSGPLPSRYGYHLVWVHERKPAFVPPLAEIRPLVDQRFLQKLADEWLALRLQQLRAEFDIVVPAPGR